MPFFHYKYLYVWKTKKLYPDWYCIIQEILYLYHKLFPSIPLDIHPHIVLSPCYISLVQNSWYYTCPCNCNHSDQPGILKGYILTVTLNHVYVGNGKILFSFFQILCRLKIHRAIKIFCKVTYIREKLNFELFDNYFINKFIKIITEYKRKYNLQLSYIYLSDTIDRPVTKYIWGKCIFQLYECFIKAEMLKSVKKNSPRISLLQTYLQISTFRSKVKVKQRSWM